MPERPWDQQVVNFLKRTGEDLKKAGEDIRAEAQKLIDEVRDPETQQKIKDNLANFGTWAKKSAEDAASKIEEVIKKADDAWRGREEAAPPPPPPAAPAPKAKAKPRKAAAGKAKAKKPAGKKAAPRGKK